MVYITETERYCEWCGMYLSRKPIQKRGYFFCDDECITNFEQYHTIVVNLDAYRKGLKHG